ncbi:RND superfamily putative drug exporter [Salana multivorans]|uniref:RND superfamily putative drug exporter n=1 Tax=Salana multivorans TaxID=120377 RepID=A0A3N2D049_9MICO|nr:MMPL family transporter [Salana multivorans]ROR93103.1 RND superfamily putative drug exporter [Salana multivorans]
MAHRTPGTNPIASRWLALATGRGTAWVVALVPLLLGLAVIGALGDGHRDRLPTDQLPAGYDSTAAVELAERLPDAGTSTAIVVFSTGPADDGVALSQEQLGELGRVVADLSGDEEPVLVPSEDGTAALGILTLQAASASEVAAEVSDLRQELATQLPDGVVAQVTGPAGIEADLAAVFDGANVRLLAVTALVVAVLLVVTYRSPVVWIVPLLVVGIADQTAARLATRLLALVDVAWNESTVGILSVLVFGAGTNYALLLISRYRDELRVREDRREAMRVAVRRTVEPVTASAGTVVVGVLALLLSLVPTTRGLGLACAVGIVVAALFVLGCLPSALVLLPRGVFWPREPRVGESTAAQSRSVWRRVGEVVARRPIPVGLAVVVALGVLATPGLGLRLGLDTADQFLTKPEAIAASERIVESFPAGTANPTTIVTTQDAERVVAAAEAVDGVASVRPAAAADGVTQLQVVLDAAEGSEGSRAAVVDLRAALADLPETYVGGPEAQTMDGTAAAARDRELIVPIILVVVLVALTLLLRAVVAPVLLVLTVVGTYFAAVGASWWIFTGLLGFAALDEGVPLLAFLFLVALGVDYNIFLVTRAREETREHGPRLGMLRALGATGGVITSAGILLAAVFATLGVLPLVVLAQLGVVVCVGVLLDTLVVRTMLVPALAFVLRERFWWPQRLLR